MGKKVSGASDYIVPVVLIGVAGLAVWYLFKKGIPGLLESGANQQNNQSIAQQQQTAANNLPTAGQTLNDSEITGVADTIYNGNNDYANISSAIAKLTNQADFNRLVQVFGTKEGSPSSFSTCAMLGFNCQSYDLFGWVRASLSASEINDLNALLSANGITSEF